jgi:hypothetical protein
MTDDPTEKPEGREDRTFAMSALHAFVVESNAIEGIHSWPSDQEISAYVEFRSVERPTVEDVERLVAVIQPDARLRDRRGMCVTVGGHAPPPGGPGIALALDLLLADEGLTPAELHHRYLFLHPFTDGNGRSARALWLHRRGWDYGCGSFLREWYYASLQDLDLLHESPSGRR